VQAVEGRSVQGCSYKLPLHAFKPAGEGAKMDEAENVVYATCAAVAALPTFAWAYESTFSGAKASATPTAEGSKVCNFVQHWPILVIFA